MPRFAPAGPVDQHHKPRTTNHQPPAGGTWVATEQFRAKNTATYEARGLKQTSFLKDSQWDPTGRTETYTYEPLRDHLASVNYGDQSPTQTWSYDFAANRSTGGQAPGQFDNLNRMTSSDGSVYQNDLLGNRLWRNYGQPSVQRLVYDELNRATSICGAQNGARYVYRADGMRVQKISGLTVAWNPGDDDGGSGWYDENWTTNKATTRYFYDGQMCMEEEFMPAAGDTGQESVTRYGLGARGIDCIEKTVDYGTPTHAYPVYDGHGNMVATISTAGTLSNQRAYDVWGGVRAQNGVSSNPSERYVGNLGHKSDDESGLIYMRARYYDPSTGRFVTEDPARDGSNWFVYCNNDPVNRVDVSGRSGEELSAAFYTRAMRWLKRLGGPVAGFVLELIEQAFVGNGLSVDRLVLKALQGELAFVVIAGLGRLFVGMVASYIEGIVNIGWAGATAMTMVFAYGLTILSILAATILAGSEAVINEWAPAP